MPKIKTKPLVLSRTRILKGMPVVDLAAEVGVSKNTIYSIERGIFNPSPQVAAAIVKALDTDFDAVFEIVEG